MADELTAVVYRFRDFEVDERAFQLRRGGQPLPITRQVFDFIRFLLRHRDRPVTKSELLDTIWAGRVVGDESVSRCVSTARRLLGDSGETQHTIKTIHGRGYWFVAPVEVGSSGPSGESLASAASPLAGRERELEFTQDLIGEARSGRGATLLISGEAGIGKTRFVREVEAIAASSGFDVLRGRCLEDAGAPPAWPWSQVVPQAFDIARQADAVSDASSSALQGALAHLFPSFGTAHPWVTTEGARFRAFESVAAVLRFAGEIGPILVTLDDVHRADSLSLDLLHFLVPEVSHLPMLLVCTHRDGDPSVPSGSSRRLAQIGQMAGASRLNLGPLSASAVSELIGARGVDTGGTDLGELLHSRSSGNPFLLHVLLQILDELGDSELSGRALPDGPREAILTLVDSLPRETQLALSVASVVGRDFSLGLLAAATGRDARDVLIEISPALSAGVLERAGSADEFRFRHVLLSDALYGELDGADRVTCHRRISEEIGRRHGEPGPHLAAQVHHAQNSISLVGSATVIRLLRDSAAWSAQHLGFDEATDRIRAALEVAGVHGVDDGVRCDLEADLGLYLRWAGEPDEARLQMQRAIEIASRLGDSERLARVALDLAPGFLAIQTGVLDALLVHTLERAIAVLNEPADTRVRLLVQLAMALYWSGQDERRRALIDEAELLAREAGDVRSAAYVSLARFAALWSAANLPARANEADRFVRQADASGDHSLSLLARVFRLTTLLEQGSLGAFDRGVDELSSLAEVLRDPHAKWYPMLFRAMRTLMAGEFSECEVHMREFLELGSRLGDVNAEQSFVLLAAELRWEQGASGDVVEAAQALASRYKALPGWEAVVCLLCLEGGKRSEAVAMFERLASRGFEDLRQDTTWLGSMCVLAHVCVGLGDVGRASGLFRMLLPFASRHVVVGFGTLYFGPVALRLGMLAGLLGDSVVAMSFLTDAIRMSESVGAAPWVARSRWERARWASGGVAMADASDSRRVARELGMGALLDRHDRPVNSTGENE